MEVYNSTERDVLRAARRAGVGIVDIKPYRGYLHVQLCPIGGRFERLMFTSRGPRTAHSHCGTLALCWHGYYEFYRNLFEVNSSARTRSRLPDKSSQWYDSGNFRVEAPKTGLLNISHWVIPVAYWDACGCRRMVEKSESLDSITG